MLIRRAREEDTAQIHKWMIEFTEYALPWKEPVPEHTMALLKECMERHVVIVAEDNGVLMGVIGGQYLPHPLNPAIMVLMEIAWWVGKEHRKSRAGLALLEAFTSIRKTDITMMSLLPTTMLTEKHLLRRGFQRAEIGYARDNRG